jgi:hypothetical protein
MDKPSAEKNVRIEARGWGETEEATLDSSEEWNFVLESKTVPADPSKPGHAPTKPPVPGPTENQSGIFESQHSYLSSRNSGIDPNLQAEIAAAVFKQGEASANGELPKKGFLDPLKDMSTRYDFGRDVIVGRVKIDDAGTEELRYRTNLGFGGTTETNIPKGKLSPEMELEKERAL